MLNRGWCAALTHKTGDSQFSDVSFKASLALIFQVGITTKGLTNGRSGAAGLLLQLREKLVCGAWTREEESFLLRDR